MAAAQYSNLTIKREGGNGEYISFDVDMRQGDWQWVSHRLGLATSMPELAALNAEHLGDPAKCEAAMTAMIEREAKEREEARQDEDSRSAGQGGYGGNEETDEETDGDTNAEPTEASE
jgi:hypothetical protein